MINRLQRLRSKKGFTILELVIVVAIIFVMAGMALAGTNTRRDKINEANTTASDFYSALQAEFTGFQMFDGPLTMSLNKVYGGGTTINSSDNNCGMKYYPKVNGNYPCEGFDPISETHKDGLPKDAKLYVEFKVTAGLLSHVNYANDLSTLMSMTNSGNTDAELCMVLKMEMKDRIQYKDGFYYARISYTAPVNDGSGLTEADYRTKGVKVDWTAYCSKQITSPAVTFQQQNLLNLEPNVQIVCGTHNGTGFSDLGTTGTSFSAY